MTHELKTIIRAYQKASNEGKAAVLATVVALEGSSYRRPGVRMLLISDGSFIGAVSGGCVEKEIWRQAQEVFTGDLPKVMTYDGRYRLGCEGILHILIEPFKPDNAFIDSFWEAIRNRNYIQYRCYYSDNRDYEATMGTFIKFKAQWLAVRSSYTPKEELSVFEQEQSPCFRLLIIGAEHDAVQLCSYAAMSGWEVSVVAAPSEEKTLNDFPGAIELLTVLPEDLTIDALDNQSAVMLMTHSYVKDLTFLLRLSSAKPLYIGLLGPASRREKLLNELLERNPDVGLTFLESIYGPAGLNLGAETPQEIAISILSEILSVQRKAQPISLKDKAGSIHQS